MNSSWIDFWPLPKFSFLRRLAGSWPCGNGRSWNGLLKENLNDNSNFRDEVSKIVGREKNHLMNLYSENNYILDRNLMTDFAVK